MSKERPINVAASVKQKLLNIAQERQKDFNLLMLHYGIERILYRLSQSEYADDFVLKGAMLFHYWSVSPHRITRDVDLLGRGEPDLERIANIFQKVCSLKVDDGLTVDVESVQAERILSDEEYIGVRIKLMAYLEKSRIPLQIDIGFGDAVTPRPTKRDIPTLLKFGQPRLRVYPWETVVAEKYRAVVALGLTNSRMKDFFDLWYMAQTFEFDGDILAKAIKATLKRRKTDLPKDIPPSLTPAFTENAAILARWKAFIERSNVVTSNLTLTEVAKEAWRFLGPVTEALNADKPFTKQWKANGSWK